MTQDVLASHLDDFRRLGMMDLRWNYPQLLPDVHGGDGTTQ
jgi:hypothetical protein